MILSPQDPAFRRCSLTVMDNIADKDITFDEQGVCNYVHEYRKAESQLLHEPQRTETLHRLVENIKKAGKGKLYDCLIGVSGGVDSSYVAWLVHQHGLRPLAVHLDNGWNSELAVNNIENIVTRLGFDLYTLVVNWEEFKDIQLAYLRASVVDIEVVSDHAIFATMYRLARQYRIPYILSGTNVVTEYIMPPSWLYSKMDYANLADIHNRHGRLPRKTYPAHSFLNHVWFSAGLKLNPVSILNYIEYNKADAKAVISKELGWRDYGGKHYESTFTKFYQAYILPEKFHIDKRKAHLSTLICSGQMSRDEALSELEKPLYDPDELRVEKEFVLKKLGFAEAEFEKIMRMPPRPHSAYRSDLKWKRRYQNLLEKTAPVRHIFRNNRKGSV